MATFEIFGETSPTPEPTRLRLAHTALGITVQAVNAEGEKVHCVNLITFQPDGKVYFHAAVNVELGFPLDSAGELEITG